jgi:2-(1,2-epoxy-1,2-dihydrophenyl)acetyl-CoA isomerase
MNDDTSILVEIDRETGVAILRLNRPARFNAFTLDMIDRWARALEDLERDADVRVLVVTGSGKAFCAGGDVDELEQFLTMDAPGRKSYLWDHVHRIPLLLQRIRFPVIAAINGAARGAGLDMALMCDLRVIDASATVAESYITMGLVPGDGGAWFLPRLVGCAKALELLWTGDAIDAETAVRIGLANQVAPAGSALEQALALAKRIASQPPYAVSLIKRLVYDASASGIPFRAHLDTVSSHMAVVEDTPEFRQRLQRFRSRDR